MNDTIENINSINKIRRKQTKTEMNLNGIKTRFLCL